MKGILLGMLLLWAGTAAAQRPAAGEPFVITRTEPQFRGGDLTAFRCWAAREFTERCLRYNPSLAEMWDCSPLGTRVVLGFQVDEQGRVDSMRELADSLSTAGIARTARFTAGRGLTFPEWTASQVYEAARRDDVACMADTVWVRFRVDSLGRVRDAEAVKSKYPGTARCAERIVAASPRWLPEVIDCKPVETEHRVRLIFRSDEESVFVARERMPSFEGGDLHAFRAWVERRVEQRMSGKSEVRPGLVLLRFVVDEAGRVEDAEVVQAEDPLLAAAALDAVRSSPRWTPGAQFTRPEMPCNCRVVWKPVKLKFTLPVGFRLSDREARAALRAALREMNAAER